MRLLLHLLHSSAHLISFNLFVCLHLTAVAHSSWRLLRHHIVMLRHSSPGLAHVRVVARVTHSLVDLVTHWHHVLRLVGRRGVGNWNKLSS